MELKKIINIMPDEKFLDYYIKMSEFFLKDKSSYVVFSNNSALDLIKSVNDNIVIIKNNEEAFSAISNFISENSILIFHGFTGSQFNFIDSLPNGIKKIWMFWGQDGYRAIPTSRYLKLNSYRLTHSNSILNKILCHIKFGYNYFLRANNKKTIEIINRMDYCATWIDKDFQLVKKYNKGIKSIYFSYYTKEFLKLELINLSKPNRERIFLGNSADHSNNHVDALEYLFKQKFEGEIICPLSYAGGEMYINNIIELGKRLFGERFIPLVDFISLDKYHEIINSCGIIWMNHVRQQAAGNLLVAFCSGKIVVLNANNPMNETFKKWGLVFFVKDNIFASEGITENELKKNREIILEKVTIESNRSFFQKIDDLLKHN